MMKFAALTLLISSAAAFAPSKVAQTSTALNAFENELGVQPPLGFFDPLGMLTDADQDRFDRLRYVELKHGLFHLGINRVVQPNQASFGSIYQ